MPSVARSRSTVEPEVEERTCRICWDGQTAEDRLLSPCSCRGTAACIHTSCLQTWQRTNFRSLRYHKGSHCDLCKSQFTGPGVLSPPGVGIMRRCQACQRMYARAWALPVVQPLITLASGVVIANSVACALSMGAKGAGCGWFVGRLAAIVVHAYYASFLGLCDSLSFMRELLPAEWRRAEEAAYTKIIYAAIVPMLVGAVLGASSGIFLGAAKGVIDTLRIGCSICMGILQLSRHGLGALGGVKLLARSSRAGLRASIKS